MANTYKNKVVLSDGTVLIDLTGDDVTVNDVALGKIFHLPSGEAATGTISDGDLMEYGTESLSDLTGTTWYFNSTIDFSGTADGSYALNYTCVNQNISVIQILSESMAVILGADINAAFASSMIYMSHWLSESVRTISITGGTDATNATLIAWLEANATRTS